MKKALVYILTGILIVFCLYMLIGSVSHAKEGIIGSVVCAWNDMCDWIAGIFGIQTSSADVYFDFTNKNIQWENVRISW